ERVNRIANVLTRDLGLKPGNRVLLRAPNSPMMAAAHFAVIKAGGIVVATLPPLPAQELTYVGTQAENALPLCHARVAAQRGKNPAASPLPRSAPSTGAGAPPPR